MTLWFLQVVLKTKNLCGTRLDMLFKPNIKFRNCYRPKVLAMVKKNRAAMDKVSLRTEYSDDDAPACH